MLRQLCVLIAAAIAVAILAAYVSPRQAHARSTVAATAVQHCKIVAAGKHRGKSLRALSSAKLSYAQRLCQAARPRINAIRFWNKPARSWTLYKHYQRYACWDLRRKGLLKGPEALCEIARGSVRVNTQKLVRLDARIKQLLPKPQLNSGYLPPAQARLLGQKLAAARGWVGKQWNCLNTLWGEDESGWDVHSDNPNSDAYGIPQANPGSKMAALGKDWVNSAYTQIKWGLNYIYSLYKTPCGALGVENVQGSY